MYMRLAERLAIAGYAVVRFCFRGHGGSGGTQRGVTVAGQMLDLQAVVDTVDQDYRGPMWIVAAGFGGVPVASSLPYLCERLQGLVLWSPVLDLRHTFVEPLLPWGVRNFGTARERLRDEGFILVDGEFEFGRVLFEEMSVHRPLERFVASGVAALVVHGDRDTTASHDIAKAAAAAHPTCDFHSIMGSEHGFDSRSAEDEAIEVTATWLGRLLGCHP